MPLSPFSFLDYLLLFAYLLVMVSIGVWVGRGQKDTREYFLAGRSMGWFPLGISTIASLYSAISYMGTPSEYFTHGAKFAVQMLAAFPSAVVVIFVFMPFYHRLQVYTAYEYLEKRFSVTVRSLASSVFILWRILWMGTAIYVPSLVLHTVTGFALIETIVAVGTVATLCTVLGGMRAVIWTDVVQFFVLFCGSILALWVVSSAVGGISGIWTVAEAGGRTRVLDWSLDPTVRITTWGAFLSGLVAHLGTYGTDQVSVQRYLSARSLKVMQQSFLMNMGGGFPLGLMMISIGLGLFAFYHLNPGQLPADIQGDRVFPYFIASQMPAGLRGIMIAAILAAAMSSIDSGLNSVTTAIMNDFVKRFGWSLAWISPWLPGPGSVELAFSRLLTLGLGSLVTVLACYVGQLGSIVEIAATIVDSFTGPMLGVFLLGMLTRRTESRGAFLGLLLGTLTTAGFIFYSSVSFLWYAPIGVCTTLLVGQLASRLVGAPGEPPRELVFRIFGSRK